MLNSKMIKSVLSSLMNQIVQMLRTMTMRFLNQKYHCNHITLAFHRLISLGKFSHLILKRCSLKKQTPNILKLYPMVPYHELETLENVSQLNFPSLTEKASKFHVKLIWQPFGKYKPSDFMLKPLIKSYLVNLTLAYFFCYWTFKIHCLRKFTVQLLHSNTVSKN